MSETPEKRFSEWIEQKEKLHNAGRLPKVKQGEIWWCSLGENVGVEINGKSAIFTRPVLIFKKLSRFGFMGIPLTSQKHEGTWYVPFVFQDKTSVAVLSQARVMSVSRLIERMGTVADPDFELIESGFAKLYLNKKFSSGR